MELARPGFSSYWTLGYPTLPASLEALSALSECSDFLEVGLPSRNPMYDGPVIRDTHRRAERAGIERALRRLESLARPYTLLAYMADYRDGSLRRLLEGAASAGALCVLMPDLAFEYPDAVGEYVDESLRAGLKPCFFASSRFPHGWLRRFASYSPLYVYLGLQPATGVKLPVEVERNVALARKLVGSAYLVAGFSVRSPETARSLIEAGADAVVVGSALVRAYNEGGLEAARETACRIAGGVREAGGR